MNRKIVLAVFVSACLLLSIAGQFSIPVKGSAEVAPDFTLTDIDGNVFSLSDHCGKVVLLDFFATWCSPCVQEIPHLKGLYEGFGENLVILSISPEEEEVLRTFRDEHGIGWTIARDTANIFDVYNVQYIPTLVIIDRERYIRYTHVGLTEESIFRTEIESLLPKTIYVDDDNTSSPWDGTQEHPYQNITSGLEHAVAGDTIFVYKGTYYENVVVNKTLCVVGENTETTIIDGGGIGAVILLRVNNVTITGFTLRNSGKELVYGGITLINVTNCNIYENKIVDNESGLFLIFSSNNTISRNNITANRSFGVTLGGSSDNTISGNDIIQNLKGIFLTSSNNNIIKDNIISKDTLQYSEGISLMSSTENAIISNVIINNYHGFYTIDSFDNIIYHNNFINNTYQVWCDSVNVWDNGIEGNYWSDYTGQDLNRDGVGDTPYIINENNQDNHPLMGMFSHFPVPYHEETYDITAICNSTISGFQFNSANKVIEFDVTGEVSTVGFCRIMIPRALMESPYTVFVDGTEILYTELPISNSTHAFLYFTYSHSTHHIEIRGTEASYLDVTILDLSASPTSVYIGDTVYITVLIEVTWINAEKSATLWVYYDNKTIEVVALVLIPGTSGHLIDTYDFEWHTTHVEPGSYTITANITGDDDPKGNEYTFGPVTVLSPRTLLGTGWGCMRIAPKEYVYGRAELYKLEEDQIELIIINKDEHHSRTWNIISHKKYEYGERYLCYSHEWGFLVVGFRKYRWRFWWAFGRGVAAFGFLKFGRLKLMPTPF